MKPLVSILIAAYNAEDTLGYTLQSAVGQTWQNKEIIVVDDGSKDGTAEVARRFKNVTVVSTENRGLSGAQNQAFQLSHGDYIQYLDADDLLAPDKIERQIAALRKVGNPRVLASSPWARFYYRIRKVRFVQNSLCQDLPPAEWLYRKMNENLHMQNATWLVSRDLVQKAGPWESNLWYDQDGEFFCRVLMASDGTRFVPGTGIYYRQSGTNCITFIGTSDKKRNSLFHSMKLHVKYLLALEDSERTRAACVKYLQTWLPDFYPERPDIIEQLRRMAAELQGRLQEPHLRWKYNWLQKLFGYRTAKRAQAYLPEVKQSLIRSWDKALFCVEKLTQPEYDTEPNH